MNNNVNSVIKLEICNILYDFLNEIKSIENILSSDDFKIDKESMSSSILFKFIPDFKSKFVDLDMDYLFNVILFDLKNSLIDKEFLGDDGWFSDVKIVGRGLLVLKTQDSFYESIVKHMASEKNKNKNKKNFNEKNIIIDYSSPNIAKEMHIGHLRSTVLGDALANIYTHLGYNTHRVNHIGDWGTQFGMILALIKTKNIDLSSIKDIGNVYLDAKIMFDESDEFKELSKRLILNLQMGCDEEIGIWNDFRNASIEHIMDVYKKLNINLTVDDIFGESFYVDTIEPIINDLTKRGVAVVNDGATCIFLEGAAKGKDGEKIPFIIKKNDGAYLYATNDLAAINYRADNLNPEEIVYVVDNRQKSHFSMLFEAYNKSNTENSIKFTHVGFGTINGEDGKPFKSRDGEVVKILDVIDMVKSEAFKITKDKNPDWNDDKISSISDQIAVSSMKYYDLMRNRNTNYNFNLNAMFDYNGNTAVYLLYTYARINSVFNKSLLDHSTYSIDIDSEIMIKSNYEKNLVSELYKFDNVLNSITSSKNVNMLCDYLFNLSKAFNSFYGNCKINDDTLTDGENIFKNGRLALCLLTMDKIKTGLNLLGINSVDEI